jgi:hypothetical protein
MPKSKIAIAAAALVAVACCTPQAEVERERVLRSQADSNPAEFQAVCDARAGARLIRAAPTGGVAVRDFDWPEDQDLLFAWGAPFVEITAPGGRSIGMGSSTNPGEQGPLQGHLPAAGAPTAIPLTAPADALAPFRVRLLPDSDARCAPGNSQRDAALSMAHRSRLPFPYERARRLTDAAYYGGQCLATVEASDGAAFHAPAQYEMVGSRYEPGIEGPRFHAGSVDVYIFEWSRRLIDRETHEVIAEEAWFALNSADRFANYMGETSAARLNRCDGSEGSRPTSIFALRPFAPPSQR